MNKKHYRAKSIYSIIKEREQQILCLVHVPPTNSTDS